MNLGISKQTNIVVEPDKLEPSFFCHVKVKRLVFIAKRNQGLDILSFCKLVAQKKVSKTHYLAFLADGKRYSNFTCTMV